MSCSYMLCIIDLRPTRPNSLPVFAINHYPKLIKPPLKKRTCAVPGHALNEKHSMKKSCIECFVKDFFHYRDREGISISSYIKLI